jgi:hypothetical protein
MIERQIQIPHSNALNQMIGGTGTPRQHQLLVFTNLQINLGAFASK